MVRILPRYMNDEGIHRHELEHVKQNWFGLFVGHALLYTFVRRYRLWAEAQAFRQQMEYPDSDGYLMTLKDAAERLASPHYSLCITVEQAKVALYA